jgi:hypothetical protein
LGGRGGTDGLYFAIRDHDRLVFLRRRARSIDDSDMAKHEHWCINAYEVSNTTRFLGLRNRDRGNEHQTNPTQQTHSYTPRKTDL